ncbi:hypothetical protein FV229_02850 [Methylobacterium sp. WL120]|nr:hypothetical protein FV229_02850 [Methylobacterium sp. WL120]
MDASSIAQIAPPWRLAGAENPPQRRGFEGGCARRRIVAPSLEGALEREKAGRDTPGLSEDAEDLAVFRT